MAPPAPPSHRNITCADSPIVPGRDISGSVVLQPSPTGGGGVDATPVADGAAGYKQCRAKCCGLSGCKAWVVASPSAPKGAAPAPCQPGKPCCWLKGGAASQGPPCPYCTSSVWNPSSGGPSALNEQVGDFAIHGPQAPGVTAEVMTGDTLEDVWSQFTAVGADAARAVKPTAVHGAVSATTSVPPGQNRTLTIVRLAPLKNGGDHSFGGRFGPLRNRSPVLWCRSGFLASRQRQQRKDGENTSKNGRDMA